MVSFSQYLLITEKPGSGTLAWRDLVKYPTRIALFVKKFNDGSAFVTYDKNGIEQSTIIDRDNANNQALIKAILAKKRPKGIMRMVDTAGGTVTLGRFAKTKEFGGGAGRGAGAKLTNLVEAAQCYYSAARYYGGVKLDIDAPYPTLVNLLLKHSGNVDATISVKDVIEQLPDAWVESSVLAANAMYTSAKIGKGRFKFHHSSKLIKHIESTFARYNKAAGRPLGNINKWNPGDIWLSDGDDAYIMQRLDEATSLTSLNDIIRSLYESRELIAVSLKKVVDKAKVETYNYKRGSLAKATRFGSYTFGLSKKYFGTKDMYINFGQGSLIQFRPFGTTKEFQGEIKGTTAAAGKVGYGYIKQSVDASCRTKMLSSKEITKMYRGYVTSYEKVGVKHTKKKIEAENNIAIFDAMERRPTQAAEAIDFLFDFYKKERIGKLGRDEFARELLRIEFDQSSTGEMTTPGFVYGRLGATAILSPLLHSGNYGKDTITKFIGMLYSYAISATDVSSVFIKIYT